MALRSAPLVWAIAGSVVFGCGGEVEDATGQASAALTWSDRYAGVSEHICDAGLEWRFGACRPCMRNMFKPTRAAGRCEACAAGTFTGPMGRGAFCWATPISELNWYWQLGASDSDVDEAEAQCGALADGVRAAIKSAYEVYKTYYQVVCPGEACIDAALAMSKPKTLQVKALLDQYRQLKCNYVCRVPIKEYSYRDINVTRWQFYQAGMTSAFADYYELAQINPSAGKTCWSER
jgi:hypothetical protein